MVTTTFPFLFAVGPFNDWQNVTEVLHPSLPRVQFNKTFECPHPCGLMPHYINTSLSSAINGGLPQLVNLTLHIATLNRTFESLVDRDENRLMDFDFESWHPAWYENNGTLYQTESMAVVKKANPSFTPEQVEAEAKTQYEAAAKSLVITTIAAIKALRPKITVGMYGLPTRSYWTNPTPQTRAWNDGLFPMWCAFDAILPSIYQFYNSCNASSPGHSEIRARNENYITNTVTEAVRIKREVAKRCSRNALDGSERNMPVYPYAWMRYHDATHFCCDADAVMQWNISAHVGADGIVLWGSEDYLTHTTGEFERYWTEEFVPLVKSWKGPPYE